MNSHTWEHASLVTAVVSPRSSWRIDIARNCMTLLEKHVWKSHIRVDTKVRLYQTYVLPVLVY